MTTDGRRAIARERGLTLEQFDEIEATKARIRAIPVRKPAPAAAAQQPTRHSSGVSFLPLAIAVGAALFLAGCAHDGQTTYVYGSGQGSAMVGAYDLGLNSHREAVLGK